MLSTGSGTTRSFGTKSQVSSLGLNMMFFQWFYAYKAQCADVVVQVGLICLHMRQLFGTTHFRKSVLHTVRGGCETLLYEICFFPVDDMVNLHMLCMLMQIAQ